MKIFSVKITWLTLLKGIAVFSAFLAFCISIRQKEFERFSTVKPIFEIYSNKSKNEFALVNHGGIVFYIGEIGKFKLKPRQYSALANSKDSNNSLRFIVDNEVGNKNIVLYWSDVDLNTYRMQLCMNKGEYCIYKIPVVMRSDKYYTMSWSWLDWVFNTLLEKEWFTKFDVPIFDVQDPNIN